MRHNLLPGFGGSTPAPAPLPPVPTPADPAIAEAKERTRLSALRRKGRRASILTSGQGIEDDLGTAANRPEAKAAELLGDS